MPTLTDLQQTAQGQTLGGIASNTGVAPSNAQTASSLGAKPNASQMAGTPAQQAAAIKESTSSKSTLSYLQRTESGRAKELEGQSKEALDKVTAAKELAGLGGKVGAATSAAINASFALPADTKANISDWITAHPDLAARVPELESALSTLQTALSGNDNAATMAAWKKIKQDFNLSTEDVANMYKIDPAALSTKLQSTFPPGIKMKDLMGVADSAQIEAAKKLMPAESLADFDNMTWQDAKALMNKTLDDATANVTELQKQASDKTLPESTRKMAVQRLRELGVSGEYQAAGEIQDIQGKIEESDNVTIGDKTYEVQDVLQSPEAMDAIKKVLETGDVSSLNGTPFEGLKDLINRYGKDLADKFGIKWGETPGTNKLAATEKTRTDNETAIKGWLNGVGIPVPTTLDKETLKALGITEDVINGYSAFDTTSITDKPIIKAIQAQPEAQKAEIWNLLSKPGMAGLINDPANASLVALLNATDAMAFKANISLLTNISSASQFLSGSDFTTAGNEEEEVRSLFDSVGLTNLFTELKSAAGVDLSSVGIELPSLLDSSPKDGKVDDMATIQKNAIASGKSLEDINKELTSLKNLDPSKINAAITTDKVFKNADNLISEVNEYDYNEQPAVLASIEALKGSGLITFVKKRDGFFSSTVPTKPAGVSQSAFDNAVAKYNKLNSMATKMKAEKELDTKRESDIAGAIAASTDPGIGLWARERDRVSTLTAALTATKNPEIQKRASEAIRTSIRTLLGYYPNRQYFKRKELAVELVNNPAVRNALTTEELDSLKVYQYQ